MTNSYKKNTRRISSIIRNVIKVIIPTAGSFIISAIIVRQYSSELWGEMATILLWVYFSFSIISWGNKEFLLKAFSKAPALNATNWNSALLTRLPLLILTTITAFLIIHDIKICIAINLWTIGRYIYQSYEPIIIYERKFNLSILTEAFSILIFILIFALLPSITILQLITLYGSADILKSLLLIYYFRKFAIPFKGAILNFSFYQSSLPFFLLGFCGLLHSRIDQLFVNHYLFDSDKAIYQVYMNVLLVITSIPSLIISPFIKNFYRLGKAYFQKLVSFQLKAGIIITPILIVCANYLLNKVFRFSITLEQLLLGAFYIFPAFGYSTKIIYLFSLNKQKKVTKISFICLSINAITSIILIPIAGITGGLIAANVGQWLMYILINNSVKMQSR